MAAQKINRLIEERALRENLPGGSGARRRTAVRSVAVNAAESPLGWLKARGHVTDRQFEAGERLRSEWELAQMAPSITMRWEAAPRGKQSRAVPDAPDPTHAQIAAKQRFEEAVAAVGHGLDNILWRIVCAGEGMRDAEQALGWPARAGKLVLSIALDRLADHYRIR